MTSMLVKHSGMTILETLLALAIMAVLVVMGIQQYRSWRLSSNIAQLSATVDMLFNAAAKYYDANCVSGGQLDPAVAEGSTVPISLNTLIQGGYLQSNPPLNPLVNATNSNINNAYIVQFNKYTSQRMEAVCSDPPTCTTLTPTPIGTIVLWRIQVSVLLNQPTTTTTNAKQKQSSTTAANLTAYQNYLAADCLSQVSSSGTGGSTVEPCSAQQTGNYVVFERMPAYPTTNPSSLSTFWPSNPWLQQFNQMYMTYPMLYLTGTAGNNQYFYCPRGGNTPSSSAS